MEWIRQIVEELKLVKDEDYKEVKEKG